MLSEGESHSLNDSEAKHKINSEGTNKFCTVKQEFGGFVETMYTEPCRREALS